MKHNIRSKIGDFLKSEEGRVGAKSPLALGMTSVGLLLVQTIVPLSTRADWSCYPGDCTTGEYCKYWCDEWNSRGTCIGTWHSECAPNDS